MVLTVWLGIFPLNVEDVECPYGRRISDSSSHVVPSVLDVVLYDELMSSPLASVMDDLQAASNRKP